VVQREAGALIPKGTQTGALAFGGLPTKTFDVILAEQIIIGGRKVPEAVERTFTVQAKTEKAAIKAVKDSGQKGEVVRVEVRPITPEVTPEVTPAVTPPAEVVPEIAVEPQNFDEIMSAKHPQVDAFVTERADSIKLHTIKVPQELQRQGLGTAYIRDLTNHADEVGKTITLSTGGRDFDFPKTKLIEFYKRFGFVENKGRNLDLRISDTMYRPPTQPTPTTPEPAVTAIEPVTEGVRTEEQIDSEILSVWGQNYRTWVTNRNLDRDFVDNGIRPVLFRKYGEAPVMDIKEHFLPTDNPILEVSTAGWRERLEAVGFKFLRKQAFSSLYEIPFDKPKQLTEGIGVELPSQLPPQVPSQAVAEIQEQGNITPNLVPTPDAKYAHNELNTPDGPKPPSPPTPPAIRSKDSDDLFREITSKGYDERPDQTLLRLHEAALNTLKRQTSITVLEGDQKLKAQGIGVVKRGQLVPREQDIPKLTELYNALHNPSKVVSGEIAIPQGFEAIYNELRGLADWDTASRLDFDPNVATL
ncbi:hypothetical protein LCGC14_2415580, partial [marine sediment metagenome]